MNPDDRSPGDFDQSSIDVFNEMLAEGKITPMVFEFPPEVIASIEAYEIKHALKREKLLDAALRTLEGRIDEFVEGMSRSMDEPEDFVWPTDDPLMCVVIAFARLHTTRWVDKVRNTYGLRDEADDGETADWWKTA